MELDFIHLITLYFTSFNSLVILVYGSINSLVIITIMLTILFFYAMYYISEIRATRRKCSDDE